MRSLAPLVVPLAALLLLAACGEKDASPTDTGACSSGELWTGGNEESPRMNPGEDCIACHTADEGPRYTLAGTVMGDYADPDDCFGVADVTVRVTDADGVLTELTSNEAGNFFTEDPIALPYTIELEQDGNIRTMAGAVGTGACASCHTAEGTGGAPGRVVAP